MGLFGVFMMLAHLSVALGLAYIVWIFAAKEKNLLKNIGQSIAIALVVCAFLGSIPMVLHRHPDFKGQQPPCMEQGKISQQGDPHLNDNFGQHKMSQDQTPALRK